MARKCFLEIISVIEALHRNSSDQRNSFDQRNSLQHTAPSILYPLGRIGYEKLWKMKISKQLFWLLLRVGNEWIGPPKYFEKRKSKKMLKKKRPSTSSEIQAIVSKWIPQVRDEIWKKIKNEKWPKNFGHFLCSYYKKHMCFFHHPKF